MESFEMSPCLICEADHPNVPLMASLWIESGAGCSSPDVEVIGQTGLVAALDLRCLFFFLNLHFSDVNCQATWRKISTFDVKTKFFFSQESGI